MKTSAVLITLCAVCLHGVHASILGSLFSSSKPSEPPTVKTILPQPGTFPNTPEEEFARQAKDVITFAAGASQGENGAPVTGPQKPTSHIAEAPEVIINDPKPILHTATGPSEVGRAAKASKATDADTTEKSLFQADRRAYSVKDNVESDDTPKNPELQRGISDIDGGAPPAPLSDQESTDMTKTATDDIDRELGPTPRRSEAESDAAALASVPSTHRQSLMNGIEGTLTSLARVYDHLVEAKKFKTSTAKSEDDETGVGAGDTAVAARQGSQGAGAPGPMEAAVTALLAAQQNVDNLTSSQRADFEDSPNGDGADVTGAERSAVETGKRVVKETSLATTILSILAGLVFVGAIGLMVTGFAYSQRDTHGIEGTQAPLYPPRGPGFV